MKTLVITPNLNTYSETFIRQHIAMLPGEVRVLHNLSYPLLDNQKLPKENLLFKIRSLLWTQTSWKGLVFYGFLKLFKKVKPDVLLCEYATTAAVMIGALESYKKPFVVHFHGYDASVHEILERYHFEYQRIFKNAAAIIAVSQAMKRKLIELGCPENKITYIPYGINGMFTQAEPDKQKPHFLAVGRFTFKKAPYLTLLAFQKVLMQCPEARLTMVGKGDLLEVCQNMAISMGIDEAISFPNALSHEEVCQLMAESCCFIQHSVVAADGDSEGTPVAISEALMSGLPVVSTRHAGISDIIEHEHTGFLVNELDVDGMAHYMLQLALNPELRRTIGSAAREFALKNLSAEQNIGILAKVLESAAKGIQYVS